jgi:hypothetical protein
MIVKRFAFAVQSRKIFTDKACDEDVYTWRDFRLRAICYSCCGFLFAEELSDVQEQDWWMEVAFDKRLLEDFDLSREHMLKFDERLIFFLKSCWTS